MEQYKHYISEEEKYYDKCNKMAANFDKEFFDKYYSQDATFRAIFEMLIRHESPFKMIERLVDDRKALVDKIHELVMQIPIPIIKQQTQLNNGK